MSPYDFTGMSHIPPEYHANFTIRTQRQLFDAQPPAKQRETLERVQDRIERYPDGWLARHWQQIYGGPH